MSFSKSLVLVDNLNEYLTIIPGKNMFETMDVETPQVKRKIVPWVEKYRPSKVDEVSHQEEVIRTLTTSIEQGNLPHLLFHGPPGNISDKNNSYHLKNNCVQALVRLRLS